MSSEMEKEWIGVKELCWHEGQQQKWKWNNKEQASEQKSE